MAIFKSRKTVLALITILVQFVIPFFPQLVPHADVIGQVTLVIAGVAILGITVEDSVHAWAERPVSLRGAIVEIVTQVLDELFPEDDGSGNPGGGGEVEVPFKE